MIIRRRAIGIGFALTGVPLGMYFNYMFPVLQWSPVFMLLSVVLITHYSALTKGRISTLSQVLVFLTAYQFLMIFYGLISGEMTVQFFTFHLFAVALIFSLASKKLTAEELDDSIYWTFILSGLCTLLGAYYLRGGLIVGETAWYLRNENEDYALEIFTASIAAIVNFTCILYFPSSRNRVIHLLRYPMSILCLYVIIFGGKRTPMLVTAVIFLFFMLKQKHINRSKIYITVCAAILSASYLYGSNLEFQETINETARNTYYGILNIFGNTKVSDETGSASIRVESRIWAYTYIVENFSILNYIFGAGYMTRWLDNPLLQSYLDMGLFGIFGYTLVILAYPIRVAFQRNLSNATLFALSLSVYGALSSINSGHPYMYIKYTPIIILASFLSTSKRKNTSLKLAEMPK